MNIIRVKNDQRRDSIMLDMTVLNDDRLSFRARGLHSYLMAKPDGWQGSLETIIQESREGRKTIRSAVEELENAGYAVLKRRRRVGGHMNGWDFIISELPDLTDDDKKDDMASLQMRIEELKSLMPQGLPIYGYVYILQAGPYFKIGKAEVADKRILALPIQLPFKVSLFHLIGCESCQSSENALHEKYDSKRTNGEWFLLDEQDLVDLKSTQFLYRP